MFSTARFFLRPYDDSDFAHIYAMNADPEMMRYIREPATDEAPVRERVENMKGHSLANPGCGMFIIEDKNSGALVGNVVIRHANLDPAREVEIGYLVLPAFWNQGVATEVTEGMCQYIDQTLHCHIVCAFTDARNVASGRVLEKNGFQCVGTEKIYEAECLKWERKMR